MLERIDRKRNQLIAAAAAVCALAAVGAAVAATTVETRPAEGISKLGADLHGHIASDEFVSWWFELGTTTAYGRTVGGFTNQPNPTGQEVILRPNLEPDTEYHYRLVGRTGSEGSYVFHYGEDVVFRTRAPEPPAITDIAAFYAPDARLAWVQSTFHPNGVDGQKWVEYGETASLGLSTPRTPTGRWEEGITYEIALESLTPQRRYFYKVFLQTTLGTAASDVLQFTTGTLPPPPPPPPPEPPAQPPAPPVAPLPPSPRTPRSACRVPQLRGKTIAAARRVVAKANCRLGTITRKYSRRVPAGHVISQRPRAGVRLRRGAKIHVLVSRGGR